MSNPQSHPPNKSTNSPQHDFVGDFHDSQPFVYKYDWPHQDAPELANDIWKHLVKAGVKSKRVERGVDHGVWVPFKLMFPEEKPLDIPTIQVSTYYGYDLESQVRLGEIFESLRYVFRRKQSLPLKPY